MLYLHRVQPGQTRYVQTRDAVLSFLTGTYVTQTSAVLSTFILLMMLHPDVQHNVQEELDTVMGATRLPTLADRAALPYLEAVITEVYRYAALAGIFGGMRIIDSFRLIVQQVARSCAAW